MIMQMNAMKDLMETFMDTEIIEECTCNNTGFIKFNNEYINCPLHYDGQLSPATKWLLENDSDKLLEAERLSKLNFQIGQSKSKIANLKLQYEEECIFLSVLQGFANQMVQDQESIDKIPETQKIIENKFNYKHLITKDGFLF